MLRTYEARLNADGSLEAEATLPRGKSRRVLITVLDDPPAEDAEGSAWQRLAMSHVGEALEDGEDYATWQPLDAVKKASAESGS